MKLTDAVIRQTKPAEKLKKLSDGHGLQLWIFPDGAKRWRLAFRHSGKQMTCALGVYPAVTLQKARAAAAEARETVASGQNPVAARKAERRSLAMAAAVTFEVIAQEYIAKKRKEGKAATTLDKAEYFLANVTPKLGRTPIFDIKPADVIAAVAPIDAKGNHHTALRTMRFVGQVCRFAVATARLSSDPTRDLKGEALTAAKTLSRAALTEPDDVGRLLRAIDAYSSGYEATKIGLQLLARTFVRPGELRLAEWAEFDLAQAVWSVPASRMKMRKEHHIPLSTQVVELLMRLKQLTGGGRLLFSGERSKARPISENTFNQALRRMGFGKDDMTSHGFRSTASSLLNESGLWSADAIERSLAHSDPDAVRGIYNRSPYWAERVRLMQWWSDECDRLACGGEAKVVPIKARSV